MSSFKIKFRKIKFREINAGNLKSKNTHLSCARRYSRPQRESRLLSNLNTKMLKYLKLVSLYLQIIYFIIENIENDDTLSIYAI